MAVPIKARDFTKDERDALAKKGFALADGSYPIETVADLTNAISAYGRNPTTRVKVHITKRAKALGKTDMLPADWSGSTKEADEPGPSDVHTPAPMGKKKTPTMAFLSKLREHLKSYVTDEQFSEAMRKARAHAGGMAKAEKNKTPAMSESGDSLTAQLREIDSAFCAQFNDPNNYATGYYVQEIFEGYLIAMSREDGELYRFDYAEGLDDEFTFGEPQEVEISYILASELADLCAEGHGWRLFNEQSFAEAPEWMPLFPKPGTFQSPRYGEIKITKGRLARFVDNFNGEIYQKHIPIDAEHETKLSGALGYITELRTNEDGSVDGRAEWTDRGVSLIESDRFKYVSPEWFDEWQDPATEKSYKDVLIGAAVTTRPFFKDKALRPLVASERGLETLDDKRSDSKAHVYFFTALEPRPAAGAKEQAMPIDKDARRKRFAEIAKGFTGEVETHVKMMEAIAGDAEKPEETDLFKAYVARETDLAKKPTAATEGADPKTFAEMQSTVRTLTERLTAAETKNAADSQKIATLEHQARTKKFTDQSKDWYGKTEDHVKHLESLTKAFGEDSEEVKFYIAQQTAASAQLKESDLFKEMGHDAPGAGEQSADAQYKAIAKQLCEADPKLTPEQAYVKAMEQNPKIYDSHRAQ